MSTIPYDLLGLILGVIGVVGIIPLIWTVISYQLPRYRLQQLDTTLQETTSLLEAAIQDGMVSNAKFVHEVQNGLRIHHGFTESLRAEVLCAHGFRQQCAAAVKGLSGRVDHVCTEVQKLRGRIATASDEERRKAAEREATRVAAARASSIDSSHFEVAANYDASNKDDKLGALEADMSALALPPPTYTHHTSSTFYEPVRHNTNLPELSISERGATTPLPWLPSSWASTLSYTKIAPPPYNRGQSLSPPSILPQWSSNDAVVAGVAPAEEDSCNGGIRCPIADFTADTTDHTHALIAELKVLEDLQLYIASTIRSVKARTSHHLSSDSVSWDFEIQSVDPLPDAITS
ncbi:hypothetical protein EUX98_g9343 [Antrodiella citrinella]|uniref:Uncharacterized protein n=1 Tax=Antrodiella citrinella TaxID=2447956 RepID=A0A4S4LV68_9APHY|nr:hypothetical protein EUX98_g9343 [Antrodiella citrinella]